uniref:Uncharacterized protein n=1 Tax=Wuchereria bancrofti TaxID=6293 RepID=A0A1I8E8E8_WUCBA
MSLFVERGDGGEACVCVCRSRRHRRFVYARGRRCSSAGVVLGTQTSSSLAHQKSFPISVFTFTMTFKVVIYACSAFDRL